MNNLFVSIVKFVVDVVINDRKLGVSVQIDAPTMCGLGLLARDITMTHKMGLYSDGLVNQWGAKTFDLSLPVVIDGIKDIGVLNGFYKITTNDGLDIYFFVTIPTVQRDALLVYIDTRGVSPLFSLV